MPSLLRDLTIAVRGLSRRPVLSLSAVVALGLGVGAATTVFAFVDAVLLAPLPYPDAERLVRLWDANPERGVETVGLAPGRYTDWQEVASFRSMAAVRVTPGHLTGGTEPLAIEVHRTAGDFFGTFGLRVTEGRTYTAEEAVAEEPVVVLGAALARKLFGRAPAVGRLVQLDGEPRQVVGVARSVDVPLGRADLWTPLTGVVWSNRVSHHLDVFARLAEGAGVERARGELAAAAQAAARRAAATDAGWEARLVPLHEDVVAPVRPALLLFSAAAVLVLLLAALDVGCLLLARGMGRRRELALRCALGASRTGLARLLLLESVLLAVAGVALGLLLAAAGVGGLRWLVPAGLPRFDHVALGAGAVRFAVVAAAVTALAAGLLPLAELRRLSLADVLDEGGRGGGPGPRRVFDRLVVAEVSLALVLLAATGLLSLSVVRLTRVDLGFEPRGVLAVEVSPALAGYLRPAERSDLYRRLVERLEALPGVESAAATSRLPLSGSGAELRFLVGGRPVPTSAEQPTAEARAVSDAYFATLGIPRLAGRALRPAEQVADGTAVLVNRALAERTWRRQGAVGQRLSLDGPDGPWLQVVGVVGDVRHFGPAAAATPEIYVPLARDPWPSATLVVRSDGGDPRALVPAVRRAVAGVAPDLPPTRVVAMEELYAAAVARPRFHLALVASFALLALVLAAVGLYGTQAYHVALRRHEIGVRMSLGARPAEVAGWVLRKALRLAMAGAALGLVLAVLAGRALRGLLFEVAAADPLVLAAATAVLLLAMLAAAWLPARRAARVEPLEALRGS